MLFRSAQSLPQTHHDAGLPRHDEQPAGDTVFNSLLQGSDGEWYDHYQLQQLVSEYGVWCKQNSKECDVDSIADNGTLDKVLKALA